MESSQMKFTVRPGTIDSGKKYEYQMAALLSLRCVLSNEDMWVASNPTGVGAFDDIVLRQGNQTYMLQLKHQDVPRPVVKAAFLAPKGDFALSEYFKDITDLKTSLQSKSTNPTIVNHLSQFDDINFILFTNRPAKPCEILERTSGDVLAGLNTGSGGDVYKLNTKLLPNPFTLSNRIYFLHKQVNAKGVNELILAELVKIALKFKITHNNVEQVAQKFTKFVTDWAEGALGGHYCLTKQDIVGKLTELFLSKYEVKLDREKFVYYTSKQQLVWNNLVQDKTLTVVDSGETIYPFLVKYVGSEVKKSCREVPGTSWADQFSERLQQFFYEDHKSSLKAHMLRLVGNRGKISLVDVYKTLWLTNTVPLLLEINQPKELEDVGNVLQLSSYHYKVIVLNKSRQSLVKPLKHIPGFLQTLQDLAGEDQDTIVNQNVKLQGRSPTVLRSLLDPNKFDLIKCSDLIEILSGCFNVGGNLKALPEYFIERSVYKVFIKAEVLEKVKHETFLLEERPETPMDGLLVKNVKVIRTGDLSKTGQVFVSSGPVSSEDLSMVKQSKRPVHHLAVVNEQLLHWKSSYGSVNSIRKFQVVDNVPEDSTSKLGSPLTVITAAPGMGKSILLDYIAHKAPTNQWVVKIDLNLHPQYYKLCRAKPKTAWNHLQYFQKHPNKLSEAIFAQLVKTKNVLILIDGYDEISISYKDEVMGLTKSFLQEGFSLWLTTRPHMKVHLETELETFSVGLNPFSGDDQRKFLTRYFTDGKDKRLKTQALVDRFVQNLLRAAKTNLNDSDARFTGVPLQTKLLADGFHEECKKYVGSNGTSTFKDKFDLLFLYQKFIDQKIDISTKTFGLGSEDFYLVFKEHQALFALRIIFPQHEDLLKGVTQGLDDYYKNRPDKIQLLQRVGVVTADENFNINFVHRTFAEYLAAQWLVDHFNNSSDQKLKEIANVLIGERFGPDYKFLVNLFDRMVGQKCPLHLAVINGELTTAKKMIQSTKPAHVPAFDDCGRSALHLIALHSFRYPLLFEQDGFFLTYEANTILEFKDTSMEATVLDVMVSFGKLMFDHLGNHEDLFGYRPLDYALKNRSFGVANFLCQKLKSSTVTANLGVGCLKDYLGYCALLGYKSLFNLLLPYFVHKDFLANGIATDTILYVHFQRIFSRTYCVEKETILGYVADFGHTTILDCLKTHGRPYSGYVPSLNYFTDLRYDILLSPNINLGLLRYSSIDINTQDCDQNTALHYAILHSKIALVLSLLGERADVNKSNMDGHTPLHLIVLRIETPICDELVTKVIRKGAHINALDVHGDTPLHLALKRHKICCAKLLISAGASSNDPTLAHLAVNSYDGTIFGELLEKLEFLRLDEQDSNGNTPLMCAIQNKHQSASQLLITAGADVQVKNNAGLTTLHLAAQNGCYGILVDIITRCAELDGQDGQGLTPLFHAIQNGKLDVVRLLLSKGANIDKRNGEGETVLHVAARKGWDDVVKEILAKGGEVNAQNYLGDTPLVYAMKNYKVDTVELLISEGADKEIRNADGENALDIAKQLFGSPIINTVL